jgi:hypothetical protein
VVISDSWTEIVHVNITWLRAHLPQDLHYNNKAHSVVLYPLHSKSIERSTPLFHGRATSLIRLLVETITVHSYQLFLTSLPSLILFLTLASLNKALPMSSTQFQYILTNCEIIWGKGDHDLDVETDNWMMYCERSTGDPFSCLRCGDCVTINIRVGTFDRVMTW